MMDAKYLAEIKARCEAVDSARRGEGGKSFGISCWKLKENALADIPALIAEVERLTKENQGLQANSMIQDHVITDGRDPVRDDKIVRLIVDNAAKDQQIATLRKALELACCYHNFDDFGTIRAEMDFFIHQAQEQEEKS